MDQKILKTFLILSLTAIAASGHYIHKNSSLLNGNADDVNLQPYVKVGQKLYYFGKDQVSWFKAFLKCRSINGSLASFESQQELDEVGAYIKSKFSVKRLWWVSGSDLDVEGEFYWYRTGERMPEFHPDNYLGNENCAHLRYQSEQLKFEYNDWICTRSAYYICEPDLPIDIYYNDCSK